MVNVLYGKDARGVSVSFPGKIVDAYEVNGQEKKIGSADFSDGALNFDMGKFAIRTFAVKFENAALQLSKPAQESVALAYNEDGISFDTKRSDGSIVNNLSLPAELIPSKVVSEDI